MPTIAPRILGLGVALSHLLWYGPDRKGLPPQDAAAWTRRRPRGGIPDPDRPAGVRRERDTGRGDRRISARRGAGLREFPLCVDRRLHQRRARARRQPAGRRTGQCGDARRDPGRSEPPRACEHAHHRPPERPRLARRADPPSRPARLHHPRRLRIAGRARPGAQPDPGMARRLRRGAGRGPRRPVSR